MPSVAESWLHHLQHYVVESAGFSRARHHRHCPQKRHSLGFDCARPCSPAILDVVNRGIFDFGGDPFSGRQPLVVSLLLLLASNGLSPYLDHIPICCETAGQIDTVETQSSPTANSDSARGVGIDSSPRRRRPSPSTTQPWRFNPRPSARARQLWPRWPSPLPSRSRTTSTSLVGAFPRLCFHIHGRVD